MEKLAFGVGVLSIIIARKLDEPSNFKLVDNLPHEHIFWAVHIIIVFGVTATSLGVSLLTEPLRETVEELRKHGHLLTFKEFLVKNSLSASSSSVGSYFKSVREINREYLKAMDNLNNQESRIIKGAVLAASTIALICLTGLLIIKSRVVNIANLHIACREGQLERVKELLPKTPLDTTEQQLGYNNNTPLHLAARSGHEEIVRELLKAGGVSACNIKNFEGDTPLDLAKQFGFTNIVNLIQYKLKIEPLLLAFLTVFPKDRNFSHHEDRSSFIVRSFQLHPIYDPNMVTLIFSYLRESLKVFK